MAALCRCGRARNRPGQRNCRFCNAEANARYRARRKEEERALERAARTSPKTLSLLVQKPS